MTLLRLKSAPFILIEDDQSKNVLPLLADLLQEEKNTVNIFSYEQPIHLWRSIFKHQSNINYYEEFSIEIHKKYTNEICSVLIDSVNHMILSMGWNECLKCLKYLQRDDNVNRTVLILHIDCIPHNKVQMYLHHIVNATVTYDSKNPCKIRVKLKKGSKVMHAEEILSYDIKTGILKATPVEKQETVVEKLEKLSPGNLSTFKIEVDQTEKIEKYKLKLPYMSKIHEGESKVYYEPDAVDDWDEEDPDEDLDI